MPEYLPDSKPWHGGPDTPRCIGVVRSPTSDHRGERCRRTPTVGATVCRMHGGATAQVVKAGKARRAKQNAERELTKMGQSLDGLDPTDVLLGLVWEAAGNVAFLRLKVQRLQQGWAGEHEAAGIVGPSHLGDGAPHVFVQLYGEWCDKLAKFSKMAIEAGIVERQVRLAEQQAELMAQVIRGVLRDLEIPSSPEVLAVVGRHLQLAAGSPELEEETG